MKLFFKILTLLLVCSFALPAQKKIDQPVNGLPVLKYQSFKLEEGALSGTTASQYLLNHQYSQSGIELELIRQQQSLTGSHFTYQLTLNNKAVIGAEVKVHENIDGKIAIEYPLLPLEQAPSRSSSFSLESLMQEYQATEYSAPVATWLATPEKFIPVHKIDLLGHDGLSYTVFQYGSETLLAADQRQYNNDSTVTGMVFYPDPLSWANVFYGSPYVDSSDNDVEVLNAERVSQSFKARFHNGHFFLDNSDIEILDFSYPNDAPVVSSNATFNYTRAQSGFEDVNTYYHISAFKEHINNLGLSQLPGFKVEADAHALSGTDNSYFAPQEQRLYFGEGGVDDAEDADVIIHEYGHAVITGATGAGQFTTERKSLAEALCDYFAVSYTAHLSPHQTDRVFNWDGHNSFWPGREATSTKNYELQNVANSSIYAHTDILVSCLMEIEANIGRNNTNQLVLETLFRLTNYSSYRDFAYYMLDVDRLLKNGSNYHTIAIAFKRRQVLPDEIGLAEVLQGEARVELFGSLAFASGGAAIVQAASDIENWKLYKLDGSLVSQQESLSANRLEISGSSFKTGLYILEIELINGHRAKFKLLRH